jgi:hypothetical protein
MSIQNEQRFYWLFCCLGCGLLLLAGYLYFAPPPGPALEVGATNLELTDCVAGEKRVVVYRLDNRSGRPMRVLGMPGC